MKTPSVTISQKEYAQFKELLKKKKAEEVAQLKAEKQEKINAARDNFYQKADPYYNKIYATTSTLTDKAESMMFDTADTAKDLAKDAVNMRKQLVKLQEQLKKVEAAVEALEQYSKEVSSNENSNK